MLASKLPDVGTTIFTVMSQLAVQHGAINLSQGFPDFACPQRLLELFNEHMQAGRNQYAHSAGLPILRQRIAEKTAHCYNWRPDANTEVTVMSGATECLFVSFQALVHPGQEVILFDPAYDSYDPAIRLCGAKAVHIPLAADFSIDWNRVEDAVNDRTCMIVLNSPHNPSGATLRDDDLQALKAILRKHELWVVSDEVYEHIIFDQQPHLSLLTDDELRQRSVVISSFGKTYHTTGWKIGYTIAPPELTTELRRVHQFVTFTTHTPSQYAYADYLHEAPSHYQELPAFYQQKRDLFCQLLQGSRLLAKPAAGTYFQLVDYSAVSDLPDVEFARYITEVHGVAAIPISVFYADPPQQRYVRLCFAKDDRTLEQACARLAEL